MRLDLDNLPADTTLLHQLVRDLADVVERQKAELAELEELKLRLRQMKRAMFGRRSERLDPDQMQLALEDLEADIARAEEKIAPAAPEPATEPEAPARRRDLPDHLPHRDLTIEPADLGQDRAACRCCGGALHAAGETVSRMLDYVPAQVRVLRIRRPKYACRGCGTLHQAPAPEKAIAKGMATPALLASRASGACADGVRRSKASPRAHVWS
jgi:transposase